MKSLVRTERLLIRLASEAEMHELIEQEPEEALKQAYTEMLDACIAHPEQRQWYAAWLIELPDGQRVGDLCFKGLSPDGAVEIGYGLLPAYWGKGYASEAVSAMTEWASRQPGVRRIEAETDPDNAASQRVLQKAGFVPTGVCGEEGPRFVRCAAPQAESGELLC